MCSPLRKTTNDTSIPNILQLIFKENIVKFPSNNPSSYQFYNSSKTICSFIVALAPPLPYLLGYGISLALLSSVVALNEDFNDGYSSTKPLGFLNHA